MNDDDEIVVHIEDDTGANAGGDKPRNADGTFAKAAQDDPAEDLAAQLEEQRQATERERGEAAAARQREADARREAEAARAEAQTARSQVAESEIETVTTGLSAAKADADAAEAEYTRAYEAGDGPAMAKAQRKMAAAEARALRFDEAKSDLEIRRTRTADDTQRRTETPRQQPRAPDPVDDLISRCSPKTGDWFRNHKDWAHDAATNGPRARKLDAAHATALADGIQPDTDAYFDHVETYLGLREQQHAANGAARQAAPANKPRRQSVPVAPVGGGNSVGGANGAQTVSLSKAEALAATDGTHVHNYDDPSGQKKFKKGDPIGIQEFSRRKLALQKQGAYDRSYTES